MRVARLLEFGLDAISLDLLTDDLGERLVVDGRDVAWNGLEAAFDVLERHWPEFAEPTRPPIRVTILGAGAIGKDAVEAATKYGNLDRAARLAQLPGVEVTTIGRNLTGNAGYMKDRFSATDVLVDATQRRIPSRPVVPNTWLAYLPEHAVVCDLVVDPYLPHESPPTVRGIEGIPQGDLDRWAFAPDDPAWDDVPHEVDRTNRRWVVSCYSWPGVHPHECMELYGGQLAPLLRALLQAGGARGLTADGEFLERALWRASLRTWVGLHAVAV
jgi:alanine dehydrogenase